jgi:hypothetical protein
MLRGIPSITATVAIVFALAGCSSGDRSETTASATQADTVAPSCSRGGHGGGPLSVSLVHFDTTSYALEAIASNGSYVYTRLTPQTVEIAANLREFPPDPIYPQCGNDASTYDSVIGDGLTSGVLESLGQLAADGCDASLTLASDGTVASLQPTP